MEIREQILEGKLTLPALHDFIANFGILEAGTAAQLFKAMWQAYLLNKSSINLTYWAEQFQSVETFNSVLKIMSDNEWIESHAIPTRNWAEAQLCELKLLNYVTVEELGHVRASKKFAKYIPEELESTVFNLTKQNGKVRNTGLVRHGLQASAATPFQYDTEAMAKYQHAITLNVTKGMKKVRVKFPEMDSDEASYDVVSVAIVDELATNPGTYTMGSNYSDSRGRAIKDGLSKVANPIGYKDFRALLVIPPEFRNTATSKGVTAIYLFIAELHSFKSGSILDKELFGALCYKERRLHDLDVVSHKITTPVAKEKVPADVYTEAVLAFEEAELGSLEYEEASMYLDSLTQSKAKTQAVEDKRAEDDRSELHENIWLERLYDDLDRYFSSETHQWSTPLELDASASMLSHIGLLLGDKRLLSMTNTLDTGTLTDPWNFPSIPRKMFKTAATPMLYGSRKPCYELWQNNGFKYTTEQINLFQKELQSGALGLANDLKEFIIRWVKPSENMALKVYEDNFEVECNRFKSVGEITVRYDIFDTIENKVRRIAHTKTKRVPDLEQFRTWFVTGLI